MATDFIETNLSFYKESVNNSSTKLGNGLIFGNTGSYLFNGEVKDGDFDYVRIDIDPENGNVVGVSAQEDRSEIGSENNFSIYIGGDYYFGLNSDLYYLNNSGDSRIFEPFAYEDENGLNIKISNGSSNFQSFNNKCKVINGDGEKILGIYQNIENPQEPNIKLLDEMPQLPFSRQEDGDWDYPDSYEMFYPIALIDFENNTIIKLSDGNISTRFPSFNDLGVNGRAGVTT